MHKFTARAFYFASPARTGIGALAGEVFRSGISFQKFVCVSCLYDENDIPFNGMIHNNFKLKKACFSNPMIFQMSLLLISVFVQAW